MTNRTPPHLYPHHKSCLHALTSDNRALREPQAQIIFDSLQRDAIEFTPQQKLSGFKLLTGIYWDKISWSADSAEEVIQYIQNVTALRQSRDFTHGIANDKLVNAERTLLWYTQKTQLENIQQAACIGLYKIMIHDLTSCANREDAQGILPDLTNKGEAYGAHTLYDAAIAYHKKKLGYHK